jgi:hypothetical protein
MHKMKGAVRGGINRTYLVSLTFICYNRRWENGVPYDCALVPVVVNGDATFERISYSGKPLLGLASKCRSLLQCCVVGEVIETTFSFINLIK